MEGEKKPAYEMTGNGDGSRRIVRNKAPRLVIDILDDCTDKQLSDALKKAGEFVAKQKYRNDKQ